MGQDAPHGADAIIHALFADFLDELRVGEMLIIRETDARERNTPR